MDNRASRRRPLAGAVGAALIAGAAILTYVLLLRPLATPSADAWDSVAVDRVDASDFDEKVLRSGEPVLVVFYATWCRPCSAMAPVVGRFASQTTSVKIAKINIDESPELATRYGIEAIPCLLVFRDGRLVGRHAGMADQALLQELASL